MKLKILFIILIIVLALFVRYYRFESRMTFDSEQARSLVVSGNYLKDKLSLLGQEYFRVTSAGHKLYSGAIFSYTLVPLQILFKYDPILITAFFSVLNVFTGLVLFWVVKKMMGYKMAFLSIILFLFNDLMINHSLFIWILNYLPLLGTLILYEGYLLYNKPKVIYSFVFGLLLGVGINFHYVMIPFTFLLGVFVVWRSKKRLVAVFVYTIGVILGNLSMILFDLRHNFYHLRTLWQYMLYTFHTPGQAGISYYHFFALWPIFVILGAFVILFIYRKNRFAGILLVVVYIYFNLTSRWVSFSRPVGMPEGLTYAKILSASEAIAKDKPDNFNVAVLFGFDARGFILRYPVEFIYGDKPLGVEDYPKATSLYVLAENDYNFAGSGRWELKTFPLSKMTTLKVIDERYSVYKITK